MLIDIISANLITGRFIRSVIFLLCLTSCSYDLNVPNIDNGYGVGITFLPHNEIKVFSMYIHRCSEKCSTISKHYSIVLGEMFKFGNLEVEYMTSENSSVDIATSDKLKNSISFINQGIKSLSENYDSIYEDGAIPVRIK